MDGFNMKASVGHGIPGRRPLWRRVPNPNTGAFELVLDPPNFPRQEGTVLLDPNREYRVALNGLTDVYQEETSFNGGPPVLQTKIFIEFVVTNSEKWGGTTFASYYGIPKAWDDPRATLPELAFALIGHRLGDEEDFNLAYHLLNNTRFNVFITTGIGKQSKKPFNKIERHYPIAVAPADDFVPDTPAVSTQAPVAVAATDVYTDDGVPADFVPDTEIDEIPF